MEQVPRIRFPCSPPKQLTTKKCTLLLLLPLDARNAYVCRTRTLSFPTQVRVSFFPVKWLFLKSLYSIIQYHPFFETRGKLQVLTVTRSVCEQFKRANGAFVPGRVSDARRKAVTRLCFLSVVTGSIGRLTHRWSPASSNARGSRRPDEKERKPARKKRKRTPDPTEQVRAHKTNFEGRPRRTDTALISESTFSSAWGWKTQQGRRGRLKPDRHSSVTPFGYLSGAFRQVNATRFSRRMRKTVGPHVCFA